MARKPKENLNPTKEALIGVWIWGSRYAAQHLGVMDFWDTLSEVEKETCRQCVERLKLAPAEAR